MMSGSSATMSGSSATNLVKATIKKVWQETPTVKGLQLKVEPPGIFRFQPGQWVDFHAPGVQHVGGYSICSTPAVLEATGEFSLCVKSSGHPCAAWVHTKAAPGEQVFVQAGGSFTLLPSSRKRPSLFVAGGIGITCLTSMLGHLAEHEKSDNIPPPLLLYSAASPNEFALLPQLAKWQQQGLMQLQLHTTRSHGMPLVLQQLQQGPDDIEYSSRSPAAAPHTTRISRSHLQEALQQLNSNALSVDAYVCGPPHMTDEVVSLLQQLGVPRSCISTEKWW